MYFVRALVLLTLYVYGVMAAKGGSSKGPLQKISGAEAKLPGVYTDGKVSEGYEYSTGGGGFVSSSSTTALRIDVPPKLDIELPEPKGIFKKWLLKKIDQKTGYKEKLAQMKEGNFSCVILPIFGKVVGPIFWVIPIDDFLTIRKGLSIDGQLKNLAKDYLHTDDRTLVFVAVIPAKEDVNCEHGNTVLAQLATGRTEVDTVVVLDPKLQKKLINPKTQQPYPSEPQLEEMRGKLPEIIERAKQAVKIDAAVKAATLASKR